MKGLSGNVVIITGAVSVIESAGALLSCLSGDQGLCG